MKLSKKHLALLLAGVVATLITLHLLSAYHAIHYPESFLAGLNIAFDLDREYNVPAFVSGTLLATIAYNSWRRFSAKRSSKHARTWLVLAAFFGLLSFDEVFSLHEDMAAPVRELLSIEHGDLLFHAWVIPAAVGVALFGVGLWWLARRVHIHISPPQQKIIIVALVYMSGVLLLESFGTQANSPSTYRLIAIPLEEGYELTMVSWLVWLTVHHRQVL